MKLSIELEVITAIAEGETTAAAIAERWCAANAEFESCCDFFGDSRNS